MKLIISTDNKDATMRGNIFIVSEDTYARVVDFIIELESLTSDRSLTPREAVAPKQECPRCGDRGEVRNEGFVWVECPVCNGGHS